MVIWSNLERTILLAKSATTSYGLVSALSHCMKRWRWRLVDGICSNSYLVDFGFSDLSLQNSSNADGPLLIIWCRTSDSILASADWLVTLVWAIYGILHHLTVHIEWLPTWLRYSRADNYVWRSRMRWLLTWLIKPTCSMKLQLEIGRETRAMKKNWWVNLRQAINTCRP